MQLMRCYSETGRFYVDLRISRFGDRWIASADTPDGPSLGCGETRLQAALLALDPFDGVVGELLHTAKRIDRPVRPHDAPSGT